MEKKFAMLCFVFLFLPPVCAQPSAQLAADEDFEKSLMHYFEAKNDDIIKKTMLVYALHSDDTSAYDNTVIVFYAGIKRGEPERYARFHKTVLAGGNEKLTEIFTFLQTFDLDAFMNSMDISAQLNDYLWCLYFATGDDEFLVDLFSIAQLFFNEQDDINHFLAARSAAWSIKVNSADYPTVKKFFAANGTTLLDAELVKYISETDPEKIQADAVEYIKQRHEQGVW
ncbi:MAG: hypothetical protein Ta2A_24770 [Treponemataceae bacterium]|nr:MAG: hypothetical protein Ta2A_24770 [Treponemataceae bacterium]